MKQNILFEDLIYAASVEDWDTVDTNIQDVANIEENISWAFEKGLYSKNSNLRDLAATIIEISSHIIINAEATELFRLFAIDTNTIVQYRIAFALYKHMVRTKEIIEKIQEGLTAEDDTIRLVAKKYLTHE